MFIKCAHVQEHLLPQFSILPCFSVYCCVMYNSTYMQQQCVRYNYMFSVVVSFVHHTIYITTNQVFILVNFNSLSGEYYVRFLCKFHTKYFSPYFRDYILSSSHTNFMLNFILKHLRWNARFLTFCEETRFNTF